MRPEITISRPLALITRGVIGDVRAPGAMRLGFAPLYLRLTGVFDSVAVIETQAWRDLAPGEAGAVA